MINIKRDFIKIISRHKSFINLENVDQPLLCIWILGTDYAAEYKETFRNIPKNREIEPEDICLNDYIKDVEKFILWHEEVGEDYFYPVCPYLVHIPWTESIIGCPVYPEKDDELKIDKSFPSGIFSVHGNNMYIIDELVNFPNLKIIQTHRELKNTGPSIKEMIPVFKKIQEHKKAFIINFTDVNYSTDLVEEETEFICKELPYNGLCIFIGAKDIEDGKSKSEAVKRVFKRIKKL